MDGIDLALALPRGLHLAALVSTFGTLAFALFVAPAEPRLPLLRLARISALAALAAGAVWFTVQAATIAGSWNLMEAVPDTAMYTRYGHALIVRMLLLLAVLPLTAWPRYGRYCALVAAGVALGMQGAIGHAGAAEGNAAFGLIAAEALHLLAAGAWLGSLLPLLLCLKLLPPHEARLACERFSPIGLAAVLVIAATAFLQAMALIGGMPGLLGTAYGHAALIKLCLFLAMLGLAVWNRLSLTDRLDADDPTAARRLLSLSVALETTGGLLVILTAGLLASLTPGAHQPPVWPFPWRLSLAAMQDPDLRNEVSIAFLAVGIGLGTVALAVILRRARILALLLAVPLIVWQAPSLTLLLVEAYPTSFLSSPTGFSVASIARGQGVYAANCAACHGPGGLGDGPAGVGLHIKPADLMAEHLWDHPDGDMFWWIGHGVENPEGGLSMPGFAANLTEDDRWAAIDFIHALNAGASARSTGAWSHPIAAPDLPIACDGPPADRLGELRGGFVRIVAAAAGSTAPAPPSSGVTVLRLDPVTGRAPWGGACASASGDAWRAYAVVAGVVPEKLAGMQFLVDPAGWLRAAHAATGGPDWNDPTVLNTLLRDLRDQPIAGPLGGIHVHGH